MASLKDEMAMAIGDIFDDDELPGQQSFVKDYPETVPATDSETATPPDSAPDEKSEKPKRKSPKNKKDAPPPAPVKKALTKEKPVSLYLEREDKLKLKALSAALDLTVSELMRIAIRDYIQSRPLSDAEKAVFNSKLQSLIDK